MVGMNVNKQVQIHNSTHLQSANLSKETRQQTNSVSVNLKKSEQKKATVEIRFLALSWLDEFEKNVFDGKTIDDLIHGSTYE